MKTLLITLVFLTASLPVLAATYYVDYAGGSDGNSGLTKGVAWKRAPGMKGFAGVYRHTAGDQFVFKGGVRWPVDCFQMKVTNGGSSDSNRDYYGVDGSWYAGDAYSRPLFDFEHTLVGPGWTQAAGVLVDGCNYITFDGIDFANHRAPLELNGVNTWGSTTVCLNNCSGFTLSNCVIRDWDMPVPIVPGSSGGGGIMKVNSGAGNVVTHSSLHQQGVAVRSGTSIWNINEVAYSEIHHTVTAIMSAQAVHHNYIHHLQDPTDPLAHANVMLCPGGMRAFNNLIHDISPVAQVIFIAPGYYGTGARDYIFNNVVYNVAQPCIAIDTDGWNNQTSSSHIFNNTLVGSYGNGHCIRVGHRGNGNFPFLECRNNHYITTSAPILKDNPKIGGGYVTTFVDTPKVVHTPAQAAALGYVLANAYQPVDSNKPTVNVGLDLSAEFSIDITGISRGQLGAWDVGAYELGGGTGGGLPGALEQEAATRTVDETLGSVSLTVLRVGGSAGTVSCDYFTVDGPAAAGVNYTAASGKLFWANGDATPKTITISILNASTLGNKDFTVALSNPNGGAGLGSLSSTVVTVVGNGTAPDSGVVTSPEPVEGSPLVITARPSNWTGPAGGAATFSVAASGSGNLSYQWRYNGSAIAGAVGSSYSIDSVQVAHAGSYDVLVSNGDISLTSEPGILTVQQPGQPAAFANGSFESGTEGWTVSGYQNVIPAARYAGSDGNSLVSFNAGDMPANGTLSQTFSTAVGHKYLLSCNVGVFAYNFNEQRMRITVGGAATLVSQTVSVWGLGGGSVRWTPQSFIFVADSPTTTVTFEDVSPSSVSLDLLLDNVSLNVFDQSYTLTITGQPSYWKGFEGEAASFSVVASGSGTLTYQWRSNGNAIPGAVGSTYSIGDVRATDAGNYDVVVSNGDGSVTSAIGVLTVERATSLTNSSSPPANSSPTPADSNSATPPVSSGSTTFINGSFEAGSEGWTRSGSQNLIPAAGYAASDGNSLVSFNDGDMPANGIVSQTFGTTVGQRYGLSCDVGVLAYNFDEQRMRVTVGGAATLISETVSISGLGGGTIRWAPQSFTFVADSPTTTLTFEDVSPGTASLDLLLDNVRVIPGG